MLTTAALSLEISELYFSEATVAETSFSLPGQYLVDHVRLHIDVSIALTETHAPASDPTSPTCMNATTVLSIKLTFLAASSAMVPEGSR